VPFLTSSRPIYVGTDVVSAHAAICTQLLFTVVFVAFQSYKTNVARALSEPTKRMSLILDGMEQSHCRLPHLGTQAAFKEPLKQHIQGVLIHGLGADCACYPVRHACIDCVMLSTALQVSYSTAHSATFQRAPISQYSAFWMRWSAGKGNAVEMNSLKKYTCK
jgi:hypothetical protein